MTHKLGTEQRWEQFRSLMPVTEKWAYMDHAAVAPIPAPARDVVAAWALEAAEQGDVLWPRWAERVEATRQLSAELIGASADTIALLHNTTTGIGLVAEGFPWRSGDNVVTLANEFPSNQYPWMHLVDRGVETRRVEVGGEGVEVEQILEQCDGRTRVIALSWVGYASGWRMDIDALVEEAHRRGILVFLDAIQGLGVFPLDVGRTPIDFLAADGHKWMLGPEGAGVFYVRQEHLDLLRPLGIGWNSVRHAHDFKRIELDLRPTAQRYEGGSQNMVGMLALGASLQMLADLGLGCARSAIADRVLAVTDVACARLLEAGAVITSRRVGERRSGIVTFQLPGRDPDAVRRACLRAGVVLSCRGGGLRISPHAYTNQNDLDRLMEAIPCGGG